MPGGNCRPAFAEHKTFTKLYRNSGHDRAAQGVAHTVEFEFPEFLLFAISDLNEGR